MGQMEDSSIWYDFSDFYGKTRHMSEWLVD